jgi:transcriptional regulator with XRE-family HTH domain
MTDNGRTQFLQKFGRRLHAARKRQGWTLQECAAHTRVSYSNLSAMEHGKRSLYIEHLPALAQGLGVSLDYLLFPESPETCSGDSS